MASNSVGMILLAILLIIFGLVGLTPLTLGSASFLVPLLALVAGILLLIGK